MVEWILIVVMVSTGPVINSTTHPKPFNSGESCVEYMDGSLWPEIKRTGIPKGFTLMTRCIPVQVSGV